MSSILPKRKRVPWVRYHPMAGNPKVTAPIFMAYCGVAAALRHYNRPNSAFVAVLVVEIEGAVDSYLQAARLFLNPLGEPEKFHEPFARVLHVYGKKHRSDDDTVQSAMLRKRAIFICKDMADIDDEVALFADVVVVVPRPSDRQIDAALKREGISATAADREMLRSEPWARLSFAFTLRRTASRVLRRLRHVRPALVPADPPISCRGPSLPDLHGYGPLAEWGFELARDLADFKEGRIDWSDVDAGVLISGPPGTGKTLFAEALARTCNVPIVHGTAAQWQARGYLNDFLKAMNADFDEAASLSPSILFIDEIDAFGDRAVTDSRNADYTRQAINGLLERLDGFERRAGVVVVAACNHPEQLDPAIRRAGRLDRHFIVPLPDAEARLNILSYYAKLELTGGDAQRFVRATEGMTGADIRQMVRDARRSARRRSDTLRSSDIAANLREVLPIPPEYLRSIAVHEAGHAIVGMELGCGILLGIRIETEIVADSGTRVGGALFQRPQVARRTRQFYLDEIARSLAGIAAETIVFGSFSDGATGAESADLVHATRIATLVEACLGMGHTFMVESEDEIGMARLRATNPELRRSVQKLLGDEFERAKAILERHLDGLDEVAAELLDARYLSGDVVSSILDRCRGYRAKVSLKKVP